MQAELHIHDVIYNTQGAPGRVDARSLTLEPGEMMILEYWKAVSRKKESMINVIMNQMSIIQNKMFITHIHVHTYNVHVHVCACPITTL